MLLISTSLFVSAWIVVPPPTSLLLPLGVVAPEISPWLVVLNVIGMLLALVGCRGLPRRLAWAGGLAGLLLSALPLVQLPAVEQQLEAAMQRGLGVNYLAQVSGPVQAQMRSQPFVLADVFTGLEPVKARYTAGIRFTTPDQVSLSLDLYRPLQVGSYPAIVVLYGGGWQNGSPRQNVEFNRYMAARGYTVFAIDYRHAPRYRFPNQLEDVHSALAFIRQHAAQYEADPARIALLGRSAGAHLAMLAAYQTTPLPVQAVVSYYGPVDLTDGYANPPQPDPLDVRVILKAFLGGSPQELPHQYQVASPISYVTHPLLPTLLVYGGRDHVVQVRFGRQLFNRLRQVGSTAVLLEIPWAEHAF
ncbi:MAG TPA: alpha/beta hydrolase, partial [Candidatus Caenarcaniphilales bacterium]